MLSRSFLAVTFAVVLAFAAIASAGGDAKKPSPGTDRDKAGWKTLFDGKSLAGWKEANFGGEGEVRIEGAATVRDQGKARTGFSCPGKDFPGVNHESTRGGNKPKGRRSCCPPT